MKKFAKKSISFAIILSLTLGTAGALGVNFSSAETFSTTMNGSGQYVFESVSDSATNKVPADFGTPAADGRVWTDKTVKVNSNGSGISTNYNVTLSALAQEYKYTIEELQAAKKGTADVLMILDFTGSMFKYYVSIDEEYKYTQISSKKYVFENDPANGEYESLTEVNLARLDAAKNKYQSVTLSGKSSSASSILRIRRIEASIIAVNKAMEEIMSANPDNRIEIACYNTDYYTFAELASYKPNSNGDYVSFDYDATNPVQEETGMMNASGAQYKKIGETSYTNFEKAQKIGSSTYSQSGIAKACNHFLNTSLKNVDFNGKKRTPFVLYMTDGRSLRSYVDWYNNPPKGNYYSAASTENRDDDEGAGYKSNNDYAVSALTILTAAYQKNLIQEKYRSEKLNNDSTTEVQWFNIGIGVDPIQDPATAKCFQFMLDPSAIPSGSKIKEYIDNYCKATDKTDKKYIDLDDDEDAYEYCSNGFVSFVDTSSAIKGAFNSLGTTVAKATGDTVIPITKTGTDGGVFITFTDELGENTQLAKAEGKEYYDLSMTLGGVTYKALPDSSDSSLYYLYSDTSQKTGKMESTVTIDETNNKIVWKINAEELPIIKFADRDNPGNAVDVDGDGDTEVYVGCNPVELSYNVVLTDGGNAEIQKSGGDKIYSNAFNAADNATIGSASAKFTPKTTNSYYYNTLDSSKKSVEADVTKASNITSTATTVSSNKWVDDEYSISLGNNGRIAGIAKIEITSDATEAKSPSDYVEYTIKATNLTKKAINLTIADALPKCVSFSSADTDATGASKKVTTAPTDWTISGLGAGESKIIKVKAKVNNDSPKSTSASALITKVNGETLETPASDSVDISTKYTLTYDVNGGVLPEGTPNTTNYTYEDSLTLATPTLEGRTFAGWKVKKKVGAWTPVGKVFGPSGLSVGTHKYGNVTLVAQWNATYSYTAKDHGKVQLGTNTAANTDTETIDAVSGTASTVTAVPDSGYYFDGWYSDSSCADKVSDSAAFTQDKADTNDAAIKAYKNGTFYAKFSPMLSIEKNASTKSTTVLPGDRITYTIRVTNNTDKALSEIYVKDAVPAGLGSLNFSFNGTGKSYTVSCDNLIDKTTNEKVFKISEIAAGKSAEFEFSALISEDSTADSYTNTAKVTSFKYDGTTITDFNPDDSVKTDVSEHVKVVYHFVDKPQTVDAGTGPQSLLPATDFIAIDTAYTSKKKGRDTKREIACDGYTFDCWYTDEACTTKYADGTELTSSNPTGGVLNLYGKWTKIVYDIEYILDGGEFKKDGAVVANPNPTKYSVDTSTFTLTNPTKKGYTFGGWTGTGLSTASTEVSVATGSTGNRTYTSTWTKNSNAVTFDSNGHGNSVEGISKLDYGEKVSKPKDPSAKGYTFGGWYKEPECKNAWDFDTDTMPDETLVLYAKWTPIEYNITYKLDDGIFSDPSGNKIDNPNAKTYNSDTTSFTLSNPTKKGYTFNGWTGTGLDKATMTVTIAKGSTGDREYTATWIKNSNAVTFDTNGHGGSVPGVNKLDCGEKVSKPDDPKAQDYVFGGWYKEPECKNAWNFDTDTMPDEPLVLYAKWTPIEYTITYDLDGGSVVSSNPSKYSAQSADFTLINPTREGYTFVGWTGTDLSVASTAVTIVHGSTGNRTYKANWRSVDVGLKYDAPAAGPYEAKDPKFTTPKDEIVPLSDGIIVDPNGGEWKHGGSTYTESTELALAGDTAIGKPTREAYIFMGWEKSTEGGKMKLTATWMTDSIGTEKDKSEKADSIPDIYQKKVVFRIKNGKWNDGSKEDIVMVVNLVNENGELDVNGTAKIEIPEGMVPVKGFKKKDGSWVIEPQSILSGDSESVYIFKYASNKMTDTAGDDGNNSKVSGRTNTGDAADIESAVLYAGGGILALIIAVWMLRRKLR